ncbi:MAG: ester cyclase [Caldilineaceae bacterium]
MLKGRKNHIAKVAVVLTVFAAILSYAFTGTTAVVAADNASSLAATEHKVLVQAAVDDVLNGRDVSAIESLFAENFVRYDTESPDVLLGRKGMSFVTDYYRKAFPDLKYTVEDVIAEGDRVVTRWTATGTQQGAFRLLAPTGNRVKWSGVTIWQVRDGKILTAWLDQNTAGLAEQLGGSAETSWGPAYYR